MTLQRHLSFIKGWRGKWACPGLVGRVPPAQIDPMENKKWVIPAIVHALGIGTVSHCVGVALRNQNEKSEFNQKTIAIGFYGLGFFFFFR